MVAIAANPITRLVAIGFIAGVLAILTFHQGAIGVLQLIEGRPLTIYGTRPIPPFGVPQIVNSAFWGGLWGIVFLYAMRRFAGRLPGWAIAAIVGAVATTAVAWFIVAPLKGLPVAQGFVLASLWRGPLINGMFGLGAGLFAERLAKRM